jgi:hypothetical protein
MLYSYLIHTLDLSQDEMLHGKKLQEIVLRSSAYRWKQDGHCRSLRKLMKKNNNHVDNYYGISHYLLHDSPAIARQRARLRAARTRLLTEDKRHGIEVVSTKCPTCSYGRDTQKHYLFRCSSVEARKARLSAIDKLYFPATVPIQKDIDNLDNSIIIFTDGSSHIDLHKSGSAALTCFPSTNPPIGRFNRIKLSRSLYLAIT